MRRTSSMAEAAPTRPAHRPLLNVPKPDIDEHGAPIEGQPQVSTTRLFMQLQAFGGCGDVGKIAGAFKGPGVIYEDVNDPRGVAVLTWSEEPAHFATRV